MMTYILIGIFFMFTLEYGANTQKFREIVKIDYPNLHNFQITWGMRIIGILLWPFCLAIFLYNFFKQFFK